MSFNEFGEVATRVGVAGMEKLLNETLARAQRQHLLPASEVNVDTTE